MFGDRISYKWFLASRMVKGFDISRVVLDSEGKQQLVYKHAISLFHAMESS